MSSIRKKDKVRKVREEDGEFFVSFENQAAYFCVPPHLQDKIRAAEAGRVEIIFTFDRDGNIETIE